MDPEAEWGRDGVSCTFCSSDRAQVRCDVLVQDLGNTNFSIHLPRTSFDRHATAEVVLRAVRALGVDARVNDRNDVCVEGYKMSRVASFFVVCGMGGLMGFVCARTSRARRIRS